MTSKLAAVFGLAPIAAILAGVLVFSGSKPMWLDEYLTLYAVDHSSVAELVSSYDAKINAAPPLYFFVAFGFTQVFGASAFSLRVLSAFCICSGLVVLGLVLRRHFGGVVAVVSVLATLAISGLLLDHCLEARFYGFYFLAAALFVAAVDHANRQHSLGRRDALLVVSATAFFCWSFYLGIVYVTAAGSLLLLVDALSRRIQWSLYASIAAGAVTLLVALPWLLRSEYQTPGWIGRPGPFALFGAGDTGINYHFLALVFVAICGAILIDHLRGVSPLLKPSCPPLTDSSVRLLAVSLGYVLVPVGIWGISQVSDPLFVDRYLLATLLGYAVFFAFGLRFVAGAGLEGRSPIYHRDRRGKLSLVPMVGFLACVGLAIYPFIYLGHLVRNPTDTQVERAGWIADGLPVAVCGPFSYFNWLTALADRRRVTLLVLDEMEAHRWKQFHRGILSEPVEKFLEKHSLFWLVSEGLDGENVVEAVRQRGIPIQMVRMENGISLLRVGELR